MARVGLALADQRAPGPVSQPPTQHHPPPRITGHSPCGRRAGHVCRAPAGARQLALSLVLLAEPVAPVAVSARGPEATDRAERVGSERDVAGVEGPHPGVDEGRLDAEIQRREGIDEVVGEPSRTAAGERRPQRARRSGQRRVGVRPERDQRLGPAGFHRHVVLDEREHVGIAGGQCAVSRHRRPIGADLHDRRVAHAGPLERSQTAVERSRGTRDYGNCQRPHDDPSRFTARIVINISKSGSL